METTDALLLFVRNPELGKVKTRLAAGVGDQRALAIYLELLNHTRKVAQAVSARRVLYYSHFIDEEDGWPASAFEKRLQPQVPDLGVRMHSAFQETFTFAQKAVIIGSDCPLLHEEHIKKAFSLLDEHNFVLGPAMDGGYYLLGMRQSSPELFSDMPWSTEQVADLTRVRMKKQGGTIGELPELPDIDYAEDWERYGWAF